MTTQIFREEYVFPAEAQVKADVDAALKTVSALGKRLAQFLKDALATSAADALNAPSELFIGLACEEMCCNIVHHDHLDIHGTDRIRLLDSANTDPEDLALLLAQIAQARGLRSWVEAEITAELLEIRVSLVRPFPKFSEKWETAGREPTDEELEQPCGRGLLLVRKALPEGEIKQDEKGVWWMFFRCRLQYPADITAPPST